MASRFQVNPSLTLFCDLLKAVAYLYSTKELGLEYHPSEDPKLVSFSDASWATDYVGSRSLSGGCIQFGGNTIFSTVKKQSIIARSSCEAEWIACHVMCRQSEFFLETCCNSWGGMQHNLHCILIVNPVLICRRIYRDVKRNLDIFD